MQRSYVIIVILLMIAEFFIVRHYYSFDSSDSNIEQKLDNLEKQISILSNKKDSIRLIIDTINTEIVHNNNYYEEINNTIVNQPSDSDAAFVRYYICRYAESHGLNLQ